MIPRIHRWMWAKNAFMLQQFSGNLSNWASRKSTQSIHQSRGHGNHSHKMSINLELVPDDRVQFAISLYPTPAWNVQIARAPSTRSNTGESNSFSFESLKDISYKATRNAWYMLLNAFNILYIIGPSANVFSSKLAVPRMRSCKSVVSGKDPPWWYHSGWCCAEEGTWIFPFYNSAHDRRLYIQPK